VRGGPIERRAFLDRALLTTYPGHVQRLATYGRSLLQRNRLLGSALANGSRADPAEIDAWDEKLIREGSRIIWNRRQYVEAMKKELPNPLADSEALDIAYLSTAGGEEAEIPAIEEEFRSRLTEARVRDERRGFTSLGPHRDDLKLMLNGKSLADFGSAGQQRSGLLALYLSQMEIHHRILGFYPVFLMDDVEAELDQERLEIFFRHLSQRTQIFLTTAKAQMLPPLHSDAARFYVRAGKVELEAP